MSLSRYVIFAVFLVVASIACQKEISFENMAVKAQGSLQSDVSGECLPKTVGGFFLVAKKLTDSNFIQAQINVAIAGSYQISTDTVNGYFFEASGFFATAGMNTIRLKGKGTPLNAGTNSFIVSFDSAVCLIEVPVFAGNAATGELAGSPTACMNFSLAGVYIQGTPLTSANTVTIQANVTTAGAFNITTNTVGGIRFSRSGNFTATGFQTIVLEGSGTPSASGTTTFSLSFGSSSCSFPVDINAGTAPSGSFSWKFTEGGFLYEGSIDISTAQLATTATPIGNLSILVFFGDTRGDTLMQISLGDIGGGINNNETYSSSATASNFASFQVLDENSTHLYQADNTTPGVSMSVKVTAHNSATKVIDGTFSGTAKSGSGISKTITNGSFKVQYQ